MRGPYYYTPVDVPHYVYRCFDAQGHLIYVGCSAYPDRRVAQHKRDAWWGDQIDRFDSAAYPGRREALRGEREAIADEKPRWNLKGRWYRWDLEDVPA